MHDYNSHFPEQGDSLHESVGGGNIILTGAETTPMAASHQNSQQKPLEFKVLPAKMHQLEAEQNMLMGQGKNFPPAQNNMMLSSRLPKLNIDGSNVKSSNNASPSQSYKHSSGRKIKEQSQTKGFVMTGERCTISSYDSFDQTKNARNTNQSNLGEFSQEGVKKQ